MYRRLLRAQERELDRFFAELDRVSDVDVVHVLEEIGPSPASRVHAYLECDEHKVREPEVQRLLDELVAAGAVTVEQASGNGWGGRPIVYQRYRLTQRARAAG